MTGPTNETVADTLERYASLLEISGEGPFRVRAYRRAAEAIRYLPEPVATVRREGRLREIPGVGAGIAAALDELIATGTYRPLVELQRDVPVSVLDLLELPGVGVKTAIRLYQEFGIADLVELEAALAAGRLRQVRGLGAGAESKLLAGLEALKRRSGRIRLGTALPVGRELVRAVGGSLPGATVSLAGSLRRMEETVADLDLVVGTDDGASAVETIAALPQVAEVLNRSAETVRVRLQSGLPADAFVVPVASFGSALVRATGNAGHLELLGQIPEAPTEEDVYGALGLPWLPPEVRLGRDELDRARAGQLDSLVRLEDVRGEFHAHTTWSDGSASVAELVEAAAARGYAFLGISDHTRSLGVANGLDPERLAEQRREIEGVNRQSPLRVFASAEVEVSRDGRLDFDDATLAGLDVVIASLHVGLRQPREQLTERLVAILENRHVDIVAHPSGRLIEQREGGDFDWDRVFAVAARTGTALEINADPARLDLNDALARRALDAGCLLTINCDAHHPDGFRLMEYGVAMARRAWARPDQILNCWPVERIEAWLQARADTR